MSLLQTQPRSPETDGDSSWLAGGAEVLIASVFEAGPPPSLSQAPIGTTSSSSREAATSESDTDPSVPAPRAGTKASSPLAKLYGKPASAAQVAPKRKERRSKSNAKRDAYGADEDGVSEVDKLKKELAEVRGSQLRMEEMLGRLLAGREE